MAGMLVLLLAALTLTYHLQVGGIPIPLVGAIFWLLATSANAIARMLIGSQRVLVLMVWHGIRAISPIYGGLLSGVMAFVLSQPSPRLQGE